MSGSLGRKILLLVGLPFAAAVLGLVGFAIHQRQVEGLAPTMNVAGRQRFLGSELVVWTRMVAAGQAEDRPGLLARIRAFDEALAALREGGRVDGREVAAVPAVVEPALGQLEATWRERWRPRLLAVARDEFSAQNEEEVAGWLAREDGSLVRASEALVSAIEGAATTANRRHSTALLGLALLDLLVLASAGWITRRYIVRPIRALTGAAERAKHGDFSGKIAVSTRDELGELTAAFNEAASEVERLLAVERQYRDVIERLGEGVVLLDPDGRITWSNAALERIVGRTRSSLVGASLVDLLAEPHRSEVGRGLAALATDGSPGSVQSVQAEALRDDGTRIPVVATFTAHREGGARLVVGVLRDESERARLSARMSQLDRIIAIGTLAAGVGHELNNPLAYVLANLGFAEEELARLRQTCLDDGPPGASAAHVEVPLRALADSLRVSREGLERMRSVVMDLKNFSRGHEEQRRRFDLRPVLESSVNMAWNQLRHRARFRKELSGRLVVEADEARLGQVFLNLLVNAAQAIPEGAAEQNEIQLSASTSGSSVVVTIRDTGAGISPAHLPRIFDPFFTTKPAGQGTGLGLAICQGILHRTGGEIAVESVVGEGTTIRVTLPAAIDEGACAELPTVALRSPPAARRGRVLIVDDEPLIAAALRRILGAEHEIAVAHGGRAALDLLRESEPFDVILSDVMMPELDGVGLYEAIAREQPGRERCFVFMTGGAFTPAAQAFLERTDSPRVEKPFDPRAVLELVGARIARADEAARAAGRRS